MASTLIGYAAFLALIRNASPILANRFNYAAPVIALVLSSLVLSADIGWGEAIAAFVTLAGVALMVGRST